MESLLCRDVFLLCGFPPKQALEILEGALSSFLSSSKHYSKQKGKQVERANVVKEELQEKDNRFLAVYVESKNSIMLMLSEREDRLGTMAIAVPKPRDVVGSVTSSVMLGDRNIISARMFAEHVAAKKGKIAVVSVYLDKVGEVQAQAFFMHLIDKLMKTEGSKEPTAI
jgi:hypothetical protein